MNVLIFLLFLVSTILNSPCYADIGLSLKEDESLVISQDQTITGDIELSGNSTLTIENAIVVLERIDSDPRGDIKLSENAMLILKNASLVPPLINPDNLYLLAEGNSSIEITNSTIFNVLNLVGNSSIKGNGAKIFSSAEPYNIPENLGGFGIVQLSNNAQADFTNSIIGSFALFFFSEDEAELSNLKPQKYADFDLQRDTMITGNFNILLKNSDILPITARGPFERGWTIFADPNSMVQVTDSVLNKFAFSEFKNETVEFKGLKLNTPFNLDFRDIHLSNVIIENQWGFFGIDSNIRIIDSKEVWLFQFGSGVWELIRSVMNEFDPRGFTGSLIFKDSEWTNAGEIFEDTEMKITGSLKITGGLDEHLVVSNSKVTREFPILVTSKRGKKIKNFSLSVLNDNEILTKASGKNGSATVSLTFNEDNYKEKSQLIISKGSNTKKVEIGLFSDTPILVKF